MSVRRVAGRAGSLSVLALLGGCASAPRPVPPPAPVATPGTTAVAPVAGPADPGLEALRRDLLAGGAPAIGRARALGIVLASGQGRRELTGEAAHDDEPGQARVVTQVADLAALLVQTRCGNLFLVSVRRTAADWARVDVATLVGDARPGACRSTSAEAEAGRLESDEPREVLVSHGSSSEEGDEVRDPVLRVFHLDAQGHLESRTDGIPFGRSDDETGATVRGRWQVDAQQPAPRDLHVSLAPDHPGLAGGGPARILERTYHLEGARLALAHESSRAAPPPAAQARSSGAEIEDR